jgi:hypothetical protein
VDAFSFQFFDSSGNWVCKARIVLDDVMVRDSTSDELQVMRGLAQIYEHVRSSIADVRAVDSRALWLAWR